MPLHEALRQWWNGRLATRLSPVFPTTGIGLHPTGNPSPARARFLAGFSRHLGKGDRLLWLADDARWLTRAGALGWYCPRFPQGAAEALAALRGLVTDDEGSARIAAAHRVPVCFLHPGPRARRFAEANGFPVIDDKNPLTAVRAVRDRFARFPWERVEGVLGPAREPPRSGGLPLTLATIVHRRRLPSFLGLVRNLQRVHGGALEIHLLALDGETQTVARREGADWNLTVHPRGNGRVSKPRFVAHVLRRLRRTVLFLDPDLYFFRSPVRLYDLFGDKAVLLFPRWSDSYGRFRTDGMFDPGLFAVRPGAEAMLDWWAEVDRENSACLDLAPLYFDGVGVYRDLDESVAPWNRRTLGVTWGEAPGEVFLGDGRPVGSYHAAEPDEAGYFEIKLAWDRLAAFFSAMKRVDAARGAKAPPQAVDDVWIETQRRTLDARLRPVSALEDAER